MYTQVWGYSHDPGQPTKPFPSSHQLPIASQMGVGFMCPSSTRGGMWIGLVMYRSYAVNYSYYELVGGMVISCQKTLPCSSPPQTLTFTSFHPLFCMFPELCGEGHGIDVLFRAEHFTDTVLFTPSSSQSFTELAIHCRKTLF